MATVLITGGAGYVGSVSVRRFLEAGHDVRVLDTLENGHAAAVDGRASLVRGDVGDRWACEEALSGVDAVLHCAGYIEVAESVERPEKYLENNLTKACVLLEEMGRSGVDALVFSSTAAVYGEATRTPIPEDAPVSPTNPYGASKLAFERVVEARQSHGALRAIRLRYFNVAGAWPDGSLGEAHSPETHIIPRLLVPIHRGAARFEMYGTDYPTPDGTCVRDYVHVCDLADAHLAAVERLLRQSGSGVYNLGSQRGFSNMEVVRCCEKVTGSLVDVVACPRRAGDPAVLVASSSRAREDLGWSPQRDDLETMVADAWAWHTSHPDGYRS